MIYAEASYFDGVPVQHCADREEHLRIAGKREAVRQLIEVRRADDPIPTIRRYHTDPKFRAEIEAERQAHYDRFYAGSSAAIDRANPRKHWVQEQ